ncbi:glycosyltransferase [Vallicoccus soli]|uniref:Glycosyltransferase n=1 Tax=Vallicoccus soli TaxID=2339232 RepID=A0A3A3ZFE4_9ACTN|nr:glycosyltransferase [Vallicoccus soli]RJK93801.1 glycosyltransferase [Vallicoccus soli]
MRILVWHVHGSWTTAFVQGRHEYLLPRLPERGPDGMGRATTWDWPAAAREVHPDALREEGVDLVVLQRPHELELAERLLGRTLGARGDVPAVYLEHNTPKGEVPSTRHPVADRSDVPLVHVTHFNELFWDAGSAPTTVIEHGILDPGHRYTGELARVGVVVNEPVRRGRVTGTDLVPRIAAAAPVDVYGMKVAALPGHLGLGPDRLAVHEDLPQAAMHAELARRRVYAHPLRWTSLGLSLLEAMALGMPVVALATTEAVEAVPQAAGVVTTRVDAFVDAVRRFVHDPEWAVAVGKEARSAALGRYGLERFLGDWDRLIEEVVR